MRMQPRPRTADVYIVVSKNGSRIGRPADPVDESPFSTAEESGRQEPGKRFLLLPVIAGRDRLESERELVDGFCATDGYGKIAG